MNGREGWLVIRGGEASWALPLDEIEGLSEPGPIRTVPGAAAEIAGLTEWQGHLLTAIDLERRLGLPAGRALPSLIRLAPPHAHLALLCRHPVDLDLDSGTPPVEAPTAPDRPRPEPARLEVAALLAPILKGA